MAKYYLNSIRPTLPNLLDRHQPEFVSLEMQIENIDLTDFSNLELAAYYISEQLKLVEKFGHYLLLAKPEATDAATNETFLVELNSHLSIHTYNS
jgi:hypothetical protein